MTPMNERGVTDELGRKIRAEITAQLARWVVAALAALIIIAGLGWWFYLYPVIVKMVGGVPAGAVAAFDTSGGQCPEGWSLLSDAVGRTIVGSGDANGAPAFRQVGGAASVTLSHANLPSIPVEVPWHYSGADYGSGGYNIIRYLGNQPGGDGADRYTIEAGAGAAPIDIQPPYLALAICKKG